MRNPSKIRCFSFPLLYKVFLYITYLLKSHIYQCGMSGGELFR
jgi:hypothetical protein